MAKKLKFYDCEGKAFVDTPRGFYRLDRLKSVLMDTETAVDIMYWCSRIPAMRAYGLAYGGSWPPDPDEALFCLYTEAQIKEVMDMAEEEA